MLIITKNLFGSWLCPRGAGAAIALLLLNGIAGVAFSINAQAAVIEFYNPDLNNYFITADPVEQDFVDTGAVGRWERTGGAFATGGPNQVCRFGGNGNINPATGTFYGPNSHVYTANQAECDGLKALFTPSAKSWKFESNDFLTTPAVSGACPAGLVPVYRAYNNGFARGIDSNHRITSSYTDYLQTVAAGSIGEGIVMCAPQAFPPPVATAVGVNTGTPTSATIGAAGGTVGTPDGKITLIIPAGALAADTLITIQPVSNLAHGGFGSAYQLTPDGQQFLKPITLRFSYTDDDLLGSATEFLGAAFQTNEGYWSWAGDATVDAAAKTVSVDTSHFTVWSNVRGLQIVPAKKTVRVNRSVPLEVKVCYSVVISGGIDPLSSLANSCDVNQATVAALSVNEWSVNGRLGGGGVFGAVRGAGPAATYTAPPDEPTPNTVAVSARVHHPFRGQTRRTLLTSNITVIGTDSWTGTSSSSSSEVSATANITWARVSLVDNVAVYEPSGTVSVNFTDCVVTPSTHTVDPPNGVLTIDFNANPPTYHGIGSTSWSGTIQCDDTPAVPAVILGWFFGGQTGPNGQTQGVVKPDGVTIEGFDTDPGGNLTFSWKFTRDILP